MCSTLIALAPALAIKKCCFLKVLLLYFSESFRMLYTIHCVWNMKFALCCCIAVVVFLFFFYYVYLLALGTESVMSWQWWMKTNPGFVLSLSLSVSLAGWKSPAVVYQTSLAAPLDSAYGNDAMHSQDRNGNTSILHTGSELSINLLPLNTLLLCIW